MGKFEDQQLSSQPFSLFIKDQFWLEPMKASGRCAIPASVFPVQ